MAYCRLDLFLTCDLYQLKEDNVVLGSYLSLFSTVFGWNQ